MTNRTIARFAGVAAGAGMVLGVFAPAGAQSVAQLQAQIAALMAQLAALQGGATSAAITSDLSVGSSGSQVVALQTALVSGGYLTMPAGVPMGYFGSLTQAAVMKWQAANGLPATGYFGPLSRAKFGAGVTTGGTTTGGTTTGGSTGGPLMGTVGDITATAISNLSSEEVGEGEDDVEIAGVEIEADGESDVRLTAVNLSFNDTKPANDDLEDFITEVKVMLDGDVVATIDADEFNNDNDWARSVGLDSSAVIRMDDTADLTVAVSGIGNLDSGDANDNWSVDIVNIRFVDAQGATITETVTYTPVTWSVVDFATAADVLLRVAAGDEDVNEAHVIEVDDADDTDGVELLSFTLEAEGSDITIEDLPVNVDVTGASNVDDVISMIYLYNGNEELDSVSAGSGVGADKTYTFEDIDLEIEEGDEIELTVKADFLAIDEDLDEGDTISVQISATERNAIVAEDEVGEDLADADATGTVVGDAHAAYSTGIRVTMISATETVATEDNVDNDAVTLTLKYKIEAFGSTTVYVSTNSSSTTYADGAATGLDVDEGSVYYRYEIDGTATTALLSDTLTKTDLVGTVTEDSTAQAEWEFEEGEAAEITLTVTRANATTHADSDGHHELQVVAFGWSTTEEDDTLEVYEFNLDDFKTDPIFAN